MTASEREALVGRMVRTAGDLAAAGPDGAVIRGDKAEQFANDITALVTEVERLTRERDAERQAREVTVGWYDERRAEVLRLTAEVERLREDAARLDWLKENGLTLVGVNVPLADTGDCAEAWEVRQPVMRGPDEVLAHDTDLRAAIDAARTTGGTDA